MTDGGGMVAFTTNASGLMGNDPAAMTWSQGQAVNSYAGLNGSFVNVALRILPIDAASPTHAALGWRVPKVPKAEAIARPPCHGGMTFAVFPLKDGLLKGRSQFEFTAKHVTAVGGPWPETVPQKMIVGLENNAPWDYQVAKVSASHGTFSRLPLKDFPAAGSKLDGNYAWEVAAGHDGRIDALIAFNQSGSGPGNLNRNFAIAMSSGGDSFGLFESHSMATVVSTANVFQLGNASDFTAVYTVSVAERRPLTARCRSWAAATCGSPDRLTCLSCFAGKKTQALDAGCDWDQLPHLRVVTCPNTGAPSPACLAEASVACTSSRQDGWLACDNCLQNDPGLRAACNGTAALKVVYAFCVDSI